MSDQTSTGRILAAGAAVGILAVVAVTVREPFALDGSEYATSRLVSSAVTILLAVGIAWAVALYLKRRKR